MQLKLAFFEQTAPAAARSKGPWEQIDRPAQVAALAILARLIATRLAAKSAPEASDD